ncbi:MAG TPA: glutamate-5-semialdehyde dehydrogenase [Terriglobales bacterium]|nr:glutamate-5-semialdehyde dehydrogenase [Terriglobales bacterium]
MATSVNPTLSTRERLERAREAAPRVAQLFTAEKNALLLAMAKAIEAQAASIQEANRKDLDSSGTEGAIRDRLLLTPQRIAAMAAGVREVAALPDPIGETVAEWKRPNGLLIRKVRVPLGVIGIIYESRPNVTVDTVSLALKTGNAIVLRGGKEAMNSNQRLVELLSAVPGLPPGAIELLDSTTRDSVTEVIQARGLVDVIIPRGGADLINFVVENSTVPVIETGAGNCHVFVDESANLDMADRIVINAKTHRPSVCNAAEKLLVHERIAATYVPRIAKKLADLGVELRGDEAVRKLAPDLPIAPATEDDWCDEYLRLCIAIRVVSGVEEAIALINRYSTKNSEAIVTENEANAHRFLRAVDSATVYWNASTRFSDGGEFGFGAEMGISTQKLHCRGPFALAELTSSKYEVFGTGQVRD